MSTKVVAAFSGGMDSTVMIHLFASTMFDGDEMHTVSFDYGQRHRRELECIQKQLAHLEKMYPKIKFTNKIIDVRYIKDIAPTSSLTNLELDNPKIGEMAGDAQPVSYVPFRNQMFLSICCSYAEAIGAAHVLYGAAEADSLAGYWDGSTEFVEAVNDLIALNRKNRINIEAPLISFSKEQIVKLGKNLGVKFEDTWTCYSDRADGLADATTPSSSLRLKGFIDAKLKDPIQYVQQDRINQMYEANGCQDITPV